MAISIRPFLNGDAGAVRGLNNRLRGSQGAFEFPDTAVPDWLPALPGRRIFQEQFVAVEDGEVCGGYVLKHQDFSFGSHIQSVACYHSALSEGITNPRYTDVDVLLIQDALHRQPLLYTFETRGGRQQEPHPFGWKPRPVPCYFRAVHPSLFLRNMETLRATAWRRFWLSLAAFSGAGWAGIHLYQRAQAKAGTPPPAAVDFFDEFGPWADKLWEQCAPLYPFIAVRDGAASRVLYPGGKFLRMKMASGGQPIGWVVALDTQMQWNRHFGDMRLGSIIDCLALPEHAPQVMAAARRVLERRSVDLIVCDHSHPVWSAALRGAGLLEGPSNFAFAPSPVLAAKLEEACAADNLFLMRGGGNARALPEFDHTPL